MASLVSAVDWAIQILKAFEADMEDLMRQTSKSVLLGIFYNGRITVIDKVDPVGTLHVSAAIGQQIPFSAGSFGKVFLA
jgi:DNA-binding IclR family transcriptional regulator